MKRLALIVISAMIILVAGCTSNIPILGGAPLSFMTNCTSDSDCVAVCAAKDCCCTCKDTAINRKYAAEWDYGNAKYCQTQNTACPSIACGHTSSALCISGACIVNKTAYGQP